MTQRKTHQQRVHFNVLYIKNAPRQANNGSKFQLLPSFTFRFSRIKNYSWKIHKSTWKYTKIKYKYERNWIFFTKLWNEPVMEQLCLHGGRTIRRCLCTMAVIRMNNWSLKGIVRLCRFSWMEHISILFI